MKLYNRAELKDIQAEGTPITFKHPDLAGKFADRFNKAKQLFDKMNVELATKCNDFTFEEEHGLTHTRWEDDEIPEKIYADQYSGPAFSYDLDYMAGPNDWHKQHEAISEDDYVLRRKIYLYDWTRERAEEAGIDLPEEMDFFLDIIDTFKPMLEHYRDECLADQADDIRFYMTKMMMIEYSTPNATDDNRDEHREHCMERFGDSHCDEALLGLHLGESVVQFEGQNCQTGEWMEVDGLNKDTGVFMFSEFSERSGWKPTFHRMIGNAERWGDADARYVIVIDYQGRYK